MKKVICNNYLMVALVINHDIELSFLQIISCTIRDSFDCFKDRSMDKYMYGQIDGWIDEYMDR